MLTPEAETGHTIRLCLATLLVLYTVLNFKIKSPRAGRGPKTPPHASWGTMRL